MIKPRINNNTNEQDHTKYYIGSDRNMLFQLIAEATEIDYKETLEIKKPKSWLKSVSAFANGIGGSLFFGVADDKTIVGLNDPQLAADKITEIIREKISPVPEIVLNPFEEDGKQILVLKVRSGRNTPYFYSADGIKQAFVRVGNSSVPAPDHILKELILKGSNQTFDSLTTAHKIEEYSFTLLEATYRERTHLDFEKSDYLSFGLADQNGFLTHAGMLLTDQHSVYNSRIFCTRWNGLKKTSIFDDAIDDKEFSGNLITLLQNAGDFIKNNSKIRFVKKDNERIDKPDYAQRAVTEALVNALIHRDYIVMGKEIHIDMYDDRVEIQSPGGMFDGKAIQDRDIDTISSARRNPVIADLFHRMRYMERRGSGLRKILDSTAQLPGYSDEYKPQFLSTDTDFIVVLKNINYSNRLAFEAHKASEQVSAQVGEQDGEQDDRQKLILEFCSIERTRQELQEYLGAASRRFFANSILKPLLESGKLKMTIPEKPTSRNQKYIRSDT